MTDATSTVRRSIVSLPWRATLAAVLLLSVAACTRTPVPPPASPKPMLAPPRLTPGERDWVDSTLSSLSLHDLVAQMVVVWIPGSYVSPSAPGFEPLERWVAVDHIGGVSPSIGLPLEYAAKLNALQKRAPVPLIVCSDFENGGPGMRINGTWALPSMLPQGGGTQFPPTMAFGAIGDDRFAYEYGRITAEEARAVGVQLLFAPVLDVNSNPNNPVIATRSFGGDPQLVARLGADFIRGAHAGGALTTGKHFPGHGDTNVDSHLGLPVVHADRARLDSVELVPFEHAIHIGVDAIMTAHIAMPAILGPGAPPATLSHRILTGLLRDDLGFHGLIFTDALTMKAITDTYGVGQSAVRAVEAGADVLLDPKNVETTIDSVVAAVRDGRISRGRIRESVRRILALKARVGLYRNRLVPLDRVDQVVGTGAHVAFADTAAARSITLVRDSDHLVPFLPDSTTSVLHIRYAPQDWLWTGRDFDAGLSDRVSHVREVSLDPRSDSAAYARAAARIADADEVIVSAYVPPTAGAGPDAVPEAMRDLVAQAAADKPTVLISFGSPYLLNAFPTVRSYLIAWGDRGVSQRAALHALFGEAAISGRLPIPLPPSYSIGEGLDRARTVIRAPTDTTINPLVAAGIVKRGGGRPGGSAAVAHEAEPMAAPSSVGMSAAGLDRVDSIARAGVTDSVASAIAVAIGRHGRLVRLEGFGTLAYGSHLRAGPRTLFDLASLTKVVGTTTAVMMLVHQGRLHLDDKVVRYLPWWSRGDPRKNEVTVRQLLLHRSGLPAYRRWFFDHKGVQAYKDAVADQPLVYAPGTKTVYSDLGFMTLGWIVEKVTGQRLDRFLAQHVFDPLGMHDTMFRPDSSLRTRIAATELDTIWRHKLVWGEVDDENADAMGGVAGHAGLFSTAADLSVFATMMLNGGSMPACTPGAVPGEPCPAARPEAVHLFDSATVRRFTHRWDDQSSRALGWDTPSGVSSAGDYLSASAYGHTGFTGTSIWIDPHLDLFVILLTNRVHPSRANEKHKALRRAIANAAALAITDQPVPERRQ